MYRNIGSGPRRSFQLSFGMQAGYGDDAKVYNLDDAKAALHGWMEQRIAAEKPYLTGQLMAAQTVYAWPEGEGKAGKGEEPGGVFVGEVSVLYEADRSDEEVVEQLNELASALGAAMEQTRVYVAYRDETWVMEREDASTPTGN
jgi:hypothetical protein